MQAYEDVGRYVERPGVEALQVLGESPGNSTHCGHSRESLCERSMVCENQCCAFNPKKTQIECGCHNTSLGFMAWQFKALGLKTSYLIGP